MKLVADTRIPFPRDVVFRTYRDHLVDLLPFLPNVRKIEPRERKEKDSIVEIVNEWHGGGEIPAAARAVLSEAMLSWTDYATWDEGAFTCDFRIRTHAFTEAVACEGRHRFLPDGNGTHLETRGTLAIDVTHVRAVPRFLAGKVGRLVEETLVGRIQPNLVAVSEGVARYLARG